MIVLYSKDSTFDIIFKLRLKKFEAAAHNPNSDKIFINGACLGSDMR